MIKLKRIYEPSDKKTDGFRILVDRLWPRGVSKERAELGLWLKDIGPSTELRQWFGHDSAKWLEFKKKYKAELRTKKSYLNEINDLVNKHQNVTLLFGAKDTAHNEAVVIAEVLAKMLAK